MTSRLFGLRYEAVDAPTWHPEVTSYDVLLEENGQLLGRIHLDLHPRDRKYNHAAQFTLVNGVLGRQLPEGVLVCNFSRGLMDPDHVVTLFHEFGHLMHHVLAGRHEWARFAGVATEWDFVEAPSQMLEEWAWDVSVLQTFATDASGEPIPDELVARMRAADEFGKAFLTRTQTAYAAISYWFHQERPADQTARLRELFEQYSLVAMVPDTHFHAAFGHLEEYTSSYYTYAWSRSSPRTSSPRSIPPTCSPSRSPTATATGCWRPGAPRTPPTSWRTSWVGPTTTAPTAPGWSASPRGPGERRSDGSPRAAARRALPAGARPPRPDAHRRGLAREELG